MMRKAYNQVDKLLRPGSAMMQQASSSLRQAGEKLDSAVADGNVVLRVSLQFYLRLTNRGSVSCECLIEPLTYTSNEGDVLVPAVSAESSSCPPPSLSSSSSSPPPTSTADSKCAIIHVQALPSMGSIRVTLYHGLAK